MAKSRKARARTTTGTPGSGAGAGATPPRRRRKRGGSKVVPALVLLTAAGSACVAGYVLFFRPAEVDEDPDGQGITAPDVGSIGAGQAGLLTLVSRETGRREAVIEYEKWDPVGQGRYDATQPRAWVYLKNGGYVHLRADTGRFHAPADQRPQSGVMRGNVVVKVFDPSPELPDPDGPCAIRFSMPSVSFDTEYGAVWAPATGVGITPSEEDRVVITTDDGIEFVARDIRVVVNQVQERIELLECRRGERLTFTPARTDGPGVGPVTESGDAPATEASPARVASSVGRGSGGEGRAWIRRPAAAPQRSVTPGAGGPRRVAQSPGVVQPARPAAPPAGRRRDPSERPVLYLARFEQNVRLNQGGLVARGDILDVWARTYGGRLPEGAIGGGGARASAREIPGASTLGLAGELRAMLAGLAVSAMESSVLEAMQPSLQAGQSPPVLAGGIERDAPMTLEWDGPLNLRPLAVEPVELREDDVAARLTGGQRGGVSIADASSGATGVCSGLDYAFTTQRLVVTGLGDSGARLSVPGSSERAASGTPDRLASDSPAGTLRAGRIEYAAGTGIGRVPGAGVLDSGPLQSIAWSEQMDFVLRSADGRVLSSPEEVFFRGDVRAEDDAASFFGGFAHAQFALGAGGDSVLSSLTLEDRAQLRGRAEERLTASSVRVEFEPDTRGRASPTWFRAEGGVVATRPGERVEAQNLEATLGLDAEGRPRIRRFEADGSVDLRSRSQGIEIAGRLVDADVDAQRLRVEGDAESLARVTRGQTTIRGVDVRLDGAPAGAVVYGRGEFAHRDQPRASRDILGGSQSRTDATHFAASWTRSMTFDDATGALEAHGEVQATVTQGDWRVDRLSAWTVVASLDPAPAPSEADPATAGDTPSVGTLVSGDPEALPLGQAPAVPLPAVPEISTDGPRALRTVSAIGSLADSPDGEPATIELRRLARPSAPTGSGEVASGPVLTQLLYLSGARIDMDNAAGHVDVPGAGRLLVVDRRTPEDDRPASAGASPLDGGSARGDALFTWQGSMHVDRGTGQITMRDVVRMVHRRAGDDLTTNLEAPVLSARASGGGAGDAQPGRLAAVHAEGGVWVRSGEREVTADVVDYDADTGILTAYSTTGGWVRVLENGGVWTASAVRWDMHAGRIEITTIGGGATPR